MKKLLLLAAVLALTNANADVTDICKNYPNPKECKANFKNYISGICKNASNSQTPNEKLLKGVCECDYTLIEEALAKGADKNARYGENSITALAVAANSGKCPTVAEYLSSIGADSYGITVSGTKVHNYKEGNYKWVNDERVNMGISNVMLDGRPNRVTLINETRDDIYIYSILLEVNGYKELTDFYRNYYEMTGFRATKEHLARGADDNIAVLKTKDKLGYGGYIFLDMFSPIDTFDKYPKIVNNKVSFTRQITVNYKYKGKMYELKTPVMNEEYDVEYSDKRGRR